MKTIICMHFETKYAACILQMNKPSGIFCFEKACISSFNVMKQSNDSGAVSSLEYVNLGTCEYSILCR